MDRVRVVIMFQREGKGGAYFEASDFSLQIQVSFSTPANAQARSEVGRLDSPLRACRDLRDNHAK